MWIWAAALLTKARANPKIALYLVGSLAILLAIGYAFSKVYDSGFGVGYDRADNLWQKKYDKDIRALGKQIEEERRDMEKKHADAVQQIITERAAIAAAEKQLANDRRAFDVALAQAKAVAEASVEAGYAKAKNLHGSALLDDTLRISRELAAGRDSTAADPQHP